MSIQKITLSILAAAFLNPAWATVCSSKDAADIIRIFAHGIELNEQFEQSVNAGDEVRYRILRKQVEQYGENTAVPCMRRAEVLLRKRYDRALMHKLMEFTISNENSADETISMVMANVFIMYPKELEKEFLRFTLEQKKILLKSIEDGLLSVERPLSAAQRRNLERHLRLLRESVAKQLNGLAQAEASKRHGGNL